MTMNIEQAKEICKFQELNEYQMETIFSNWETVINGKKVSYIFSEVAASHIDGSITMARKLIDFIIIPINTNKLFSDTKKSVLEENQHMVTMVANCYSYSVGASLTTGKDVEFICKLGDRVGGLIINEIVDLYKLTTQLEAELPSEIIQLESVKIKGGTTLRAKVVPFDLHPLTDDLFFYHNTYIPQGVVKSKAKILQILIGDKNNILPGEEGYDEEFNQVITIRT